MDLKVPFNKNLSCVFWVFFLRPYSVTLSVNNVCTCAPLTDEEKESAGDSWPFLRWTEPNRKVESAYLHRPCTNEYHCSKEKGWVTSQRAAKRNRLLLLCTIAAGPGLKGGFVCPGGSLNAMAWLQRLACGLSGNGLVLHAVLFTLALSCQPRPSHESLGAIRLSKPNTNPKDLQIPFFFHVKIYIYTQLLVSKASNQTTCFYSC